MAYSCNKCKNGRMEPDCQEGEPEYTDIFKCSNPDCGHIATIPSVVIICSQLFSAIFGGAITVYLFILNIAVLISAKSLAFGAYFIRHGLLLFAALALLLGFGFLFYKAIGGILIRRHFKIINR